MIFRKKGESDRHLDPDGAGFVDENAEASGDSVPFLRESGPWDSTELSSTDGRIDLGSLLVAGVPGLSMQVQVDERTQRVTMVTLVIDDAAVQVQAFAAPRSGALWDEIRAEIAAAVETQGGTAEEHEGALGTELRTRMPSAGPDGRTVFAPATFLGVDGPRWFLRGLFLGSAASAGGHDRLTGVFKDIAVVRGTEAMPSGEPLELRMPVQGQDSAVQAQGVSSVAEDGEL